MTEGQEHIPLASNITAHCAGCTSSGVATTTLWRDTESSVDTTSTSTIHCGGSNGVGSVSGHAMVDLSGYDDVGPCVADVIATNLQELNNGNYEKLRIAVLDWEKTLEILQGRRAFREVQVNSFRNEIYQVIGFYIVFQGVLFTAVAQSSMLRCHNWWTSFLLSLLTSIVTISVVLQKLSYLLVLETTMASERASGEVLKKRINNVILSVGPRNFDFNEHAGDGSRINFLDATRRSVKLYGFIVVMVLLCFSAIFEVYLASPLQTRHCSALVTRSLHSFTNPFNISRYHFTICGHVIWVELFLSSRFRAPQKLRDVLFYKAQGWRCRVMWKRMRSSSCCPRR